MRRTLAVSMIVRNESAHICTALENLGEFADEVVVLDTGSTDETKRLAAERGALVHDFVWCDDFAKARNVSLAHCTKDFVMWLDADDRMPREDAIRLRELLQTEPDWDVLYLPYQCSTSARKMPPRIFRNGIGIQWIYPIHEILSLPTGVRGKRDVDNICIYHSPDRAPGAHSTRNLRILERTILRPEFQHSSYMLWHIAKEYSALRDPPKAIHFYRAAIRCASPSRSFMISRQYHGLARQYHRLGQASQAAEEFGKSALFYPHWREPYCGMADSLWALGDPRAAQVCVELAQNVPRHRLTLERSELYDELIFATKYVNKARQSDDAAETHEPSPSAGRSGTLVAGGDVCWAGRMQGSVSGEGFGGAFRDVSGLLHAADVTLVNLECVLARRATPVENPSQRPSADRVDPDLLDLLRGAGVRAVTTANPHAMDHSPEALLEQHSCLARSGIRACGSGRSLLEAAAPCYFDVGGTVVAIVGIDTEGGHGAATATRAGVNHAHGRQNILQRLAVSIAEARNRAHAIVVSPHWGVRSNDMPTPERSALAHAIIDLGADAVLGHGARLLRGIEIYAGCPIVYDMGTLLLDRVGEARIRLSALFALPFGRDGFRQLQVRPVVLEPGRTRRADGQERDEVCDLLKRLSEPLGTTTWQQDGESVFLPLGPRRRPSRIGAPVET